MSHLSSVDFVYVSNIASALDAIKNIKPNYYFKGPDYKNLKLDITKKIYEEKNWLKNMVEKLSLQLVKHLVQVKF